MLSFLDFHNNILPLHNLEIPKKCNAIRIQEYRWICLLNVSFNIITKVLPNKIGMVANIIFTP
jgi:hypothetical protein